jgi:hypothetical protein
MSTLTNTQNRSERVATRKLWWVVLTAGVVAFIGNFIVFLVAENLFNLSLMMPQSPNSNTLVSLSAGSILGASLVPAIGAAILLAVLGRFLARPFRAFQIIAVAFLLLSIGMPFSLPIEVGTKAVLSVMHVVAAVAIVGVLTMLGRDG